MENTLIADLEEMIKHAADSQTLDEQYEEHLRDLVEVAKDASPVERATVRTRFRNEYDRLFPAGNHTFETFFEIYYDPENENAKLENDVEFAVSVAKDAIESYLLHDEEDSYDATDADSREEYVEQIKTEVCFAILVAINIVANLATEVPISIPHQRQPHAVRA